MPFGLRFFLLYASVILVGIALSMRTVVDQAATMPISPIGVVVMILLAYTIFTMTLVLQRKQAGFGLAVGLASLVIPAADRGLRSAAVPRTVATRGPDVPVRTLSTARSHTGRGNRAGRVPSAGAALVAAGSQTDPATPSTAPEASP
jgi:hypothetical protein